MLFYQRYIGQDDDVELRQKLEDLQDEIDDNTGRKEKALIKTISLSRKQEGIRRSFLGIAFLLTGVEQKKTSMEGLLRTCMHGLDIIMNRIGGKSINLLLDEMDEVGYKPSGLGDEDADTFKEAEDQRKKKKDEADDAETVDDDEVKGQFKSNRKHANTFFRFQQERS